MKRLKYFAFTLWCVTMLVSLHSCTKDTMQYERGNEPALEGDGALPTLTLHSRNETGQGNILRALVWDTPFKDKLYFKLNRKAEQDVTVTVRVDNSLVELYNQENGLIGTAQEHKVFPVENLTISQNGELSATSGKLESSDLTITLVSEGIDKYARENYLIPIVVNTANGAEADNAVFYYRMQAVRDDPREVVGDFAPVYVGYVNTEKVKPEVVNQFHISATDLETFNETYYKFLDIVNLNVAQIKYDAANARPVLHLNTDISFVLNHPEKYIAPVQQEDRKVCLVIKGGNDGIGPCNLNDAQRANLVYQIKTVVQKAGLDGVNVWDEGAGYGKDGRPDVYAASYARFLKALREAMPGKMITVVDVGEPTENFGEPIEGIEVGKVIDYAWHGYPAEIVNPWKEGEKRKPIAGFEKRQYGGVILPIVNLNDLMHINAAVLQTELIEEGLDNVFVFSDIPVFTHQKESETSGGVYSILVNELYDTIDWDTFTGTQYSVVCTTKFGEGGYTANIWEKDW